MTLFTLDLVLKRRAGEGHRLGPDMYTSLVDPSYRVPRMRMGKRGGGS